MNRFAPAFLLSAAFIFAADRVTKWIVDQQMHLYQDIPVWGEWVRLTYILNAGAAFGLFQGSRVPLVAVSILASLGVTWLALARGHGWAQVIALGLILGGALGNLVDRLATGLVIDFINVGVGEHRWPVFNVADSAVTVGVIWLALGLTRDGESGGDRGKDEDDTGDAARDPA